MPTVLVVDAYRVMIYTNDHAPAHVHVFRGREEVVIILATASDPMAVREVRRMTIAHVRAAYRIVADNHALLLNAWKEMHGE
jgi:hypothetical protein